MKRFIALAAALVPMLASAETSTWKIDPSHSESAFAVKHLVITTVRGHFGKTTGTIKLKAQAVWEPRYNLTPVAYSDIQLVRAKGADAPADKKAEADPAAKKAPAPGDAEARPKAKAPAPEKEDAPK